VSEPALDPQAQWPAEELRKLEAHGLLRRRRILESVQGTRVRLDGREFVSFCSNDYLGLAADPRLADALIAGVRECGVGAGASHLLSGHHRAHQMLEERLAAFTGFPRALFFSSGYLANLAVITTLAPRDAEIFADRLNHASLNDGMLLARSRFRRYPHLDLKFLERMLLRSRASRRLVVTDAVFSMDGDVAPLDRLTALCERHGAWLLIDDAHGFGVLGPKGRGSAAAHAVSGGRVVYVGTLGKAAGVSGAFVAADAQVIELLIQRARAYVYTTASPPALARALMASIDMVEREEWRRQQLFSHVARFRQVAAAGAFALLPSQHAIQPVMIGEAAQALAVSARLEQSGILAPAIRPPTVPQGGARLRVSLSAAHAPEDIERLASALVAVSREYA
jgi:8-amino-7-oxononanoate synthase